MTSNYHAPVCGLAALALAIAGAMAQTPASRPTKPPAMADQKQPEQPRADGAFADLAEATKILAAGKGAEAERLLLTVAARLPRYANVWQQLALAYRIQGKKKEGLDAIEKAISFGTANADMHLLAAELTLAVRAPGAARHALLAADLAPEDQRVARRAIELLLEACDLESAGKLLAKLEKTGDSSVTTREKLLWLQADLANRKLAPELAAKAYRQLCELVGKRDPYPHECLANTLLVLGEKPGALAAYERCLEIHPSNLAARQRAIALMKELRASADAVAREENLLTYYRKAWELEKQAGKRGPAAARPTQPAAPK